MAQPYNLEDAVTEYFEFEIFGNKYRFRHMNTEEVDQMRSIGEKQEGEQKYREFIRDFITPVGDNTPPFQEMEKRMLVPHWNNFRKMIVTEFGG